MSICYTCGNNLTELLIKVNNLHGRSVNQRFFMYKDEKDKKAMELFIKENKLPICCASTVTTVIDNRYLHYTPY